MFVKAQSWLSAASAFAVLACQPAVPPGPAAPAAAKPVPGSAMTEKVPESMSKAEAENSVPPCPQLDESWDFDHPEQSAQRFAAAARQFAAQRNTNCELEALTQQARAEVLQGSFDVANRILDQVDQRLQGAAPGRPALRSKLERGRVLNSSKRPEAAAPLFVEAYELARKLGEDGLAVDAAHMVAIAKLSAPDESLEWNLRATELALSSSSQAARRWLGALYNNTGWTYFDRGEYERALDLFEKGVTVREERGQLVPLLIARWCVGRTLRALGRVEEALALQEKLRAEYEANGKEPTGFVYEELAECTLLLGKPGHAALFRRAYELLSQDASLREDEPERLERLRSLGQP